MQAHFKLKLICLKSALTIQHWVLLEEGIEQASTTIEGKEY